MVKSEKILARIMQGASDTTINFDELCTLLIGLGFTERVRGDHHIFTKDGIVEILNLQPKKAKAKPYQVKQVRQAILKYRLGGQRDDSI